MTINKFYKDFFQINFDLFSESEYPRFNKNKNDVNEHLILFYFYKEKEALNYKEEFKHFLKSLDGWTDSKSFTIGSTTYENPDQVLNPSRSKRLDTPMVLGEKKKFISLRIKPLIKKWVNSNISNPDVKLIYNNWLSSADIDQQILSALVDIGNNFSSNENRFNYKDSTANINVDFDLFYNDLINGTDTIKTGHSTTRVFGGNPYAAPVDLPMLLGFDEALDETLGESRRTSRTAKGIEADLKNNPKAFAKILAGAQGVDYKKPTDEELVNLRQCALITRLLHKTAGKIPFHNYFNNGNFASSPLVATGSNPGHNRIYPVDPSGDPNEFYNRCFISREAKNLFRVDGNIDVDSPSELKKRLYWVFDTDDGLKEIELSLSSNKAVQKENQNYFLLKRALKEFRRGSSSAQTRANVAGILGEFKDETAINNELEGILANTGSVDVGASYYFLNDIEVKYEGTNPSTARNDVQVQMSFQLSSLQALQKVMATVPAEFTTKRESADIKLYELITLPVTGKISKGPGAYLKNQFNPEYSRVRLKAYTDVNHGCDLIIDLSTIDHSISRESETGKTTLTINYRGFFEAMMNMPFNDALATEKTIQERERIHGEAMKTIMSNDCTPELINSAMRIEQDIFRREAKKLSAGSILMRMQTRRLIHGYGLDETNLLGRAINGTLDSRQDYVTNILPSSGIVQQVADNIQTKTQKGEDLETEDLKGLKNKFFFLGDLLWVVSGCLYDGDTENMKDLTKNLNMRFMVGTINIPNPKTRDGSMMTINPVCIPVDLAYFVEWFNSTIVNKGLTTYPVGVFIKDLVERMINNVIYEVCFSSLLPSETPPVIRVGFMSNFVTKNTGWFKKNKSGWFNMENPYETTAPLLMRSNAIFERDALFNENNSPYPHINDVNPYNYCVIYQQFPTFSHYTTTDPSKHLKNKDFVPTIFYGAKNTDFNYVSNVSFSKTDSPFLREARYFNSSYGNLSLLSNVYDLSFSFKRRKANTFLYPGIILNFVLLDWTSDGDESPYVKLSNKNGDYKIFNQSNPHDEKALAHILGFGGYYIIKSVAYKLSQTDDVWEINVSTKFMGTDAVKNDVRKMEENKNIEDKEDCVEAYNELVERVNELQGDKEDPYYDTATVKKDEAKEAQEKTEEQNDQSEETCERATEVVQEPEEAAEQGDDVQQETDYTEGRRDDIAKGLGLVFSEDGDNKGYKKGRLDNFNSVDLQKLLNYLTTYNDNVQGTFLDNKRQHYYNIEFSNGDLYINMKQVISDG